MVSGNTISCFRNCMVPYQFGCSRSTSKAGDRMSHKGKIRPLRLAHDSAIRKLEAQAHEAEVAVS